MPANVISRAGAPSMLMRRYVWANGWTRADAPIASTMRARTPDPEHGEADAEADAEPEAVDAVLGGGAPGRRRRSGGRRRRSCE